MRALLCHPAGHRPAQHAAASHGEEGAPDGCHRKAAARQAHDTIAGAPWLPAGLPRPLLFAGWPLPSFASLCASASRVPPLDYQRCVATRACLRFLQQATCYAAVPAGSCRVHVLPRSTLTMRMWIWRTRRERRCRQVRSAKTPQAQTPQLPGQRIKRRAARSPALPHALLPCPAARRACLSINTARLRRPTSSYLGTQRTPSLHTVSACS